MKQLSEEAMPPEVTGMKPAARLHSVGNYSGHGKVKAYRAACKKAAALAVARAKCRELVDLEVGKSPEDAALLGRAMMEVGAAASRDLGDRPSTAFLLGHLSRRIRESDYIDF